MTDPTTPQVIEKVVLKNFRRFRDTTIEFEPSRVPSCAHTSH